MLNAKHITNLFESEMKTFVIFNVKIKYLELSDAPGCILCNWNQGNCIVENVRSVGYQFQLYTSKRDLSIGFLGSPQKSTTTI